MQTSSRKHHMLWSQGFIKHYSCVMFSVMGEIEFVVIIQEKCFPKDDYVSIKKEAPVIKPPAFTFPEITLYLVTHKDGQKIQYPDFINNKTDSYYKFLAWPFVNYILMTSVILSSFGYRYTSALVFTVNSTTVQMFLLLYCKTF